MKRTSFFSLITSLTLFCGCNAYVHTAHTPVVPVALDEKGLIATGSLDISGASAEAQYYFKERWSIVGAVQGGSRSYSSFNSLGLSGGGHLYRTNLNTTLGIGYLLGGKEKTFTFPIQIGILGGSTKQRPQHADIMGRFDGRYAGGYFQAGWLIHSDWFQCYAGYQFNRLRYSSLQTDLVATNSLNIRYNQFVGQLGFMINQHFFIKSYLIVSGPPSSPQLPDAVQTLWPGVNVGAGFGFNLNSLPSGTE